MALGTAAALIGGSLIGGAASAYSANKAAGAQGKAADQSLDLQREVYYDQKGTNQPLVNARNNALAVLGAELGIGDAPYFNDKGQALRAWGTGDNQFTIQYQNPQGEWTNTNNVFDNLQGANKFLDGFQYGGFTESPSYQYNLAQSEDAINRNAAARGMRLSGATLESLQGNAAGLASNEYGNYLNQLYSYAGMGQQGATSQNQAAQNYASTGGNALMAGGAARASGYTGLNNALQGTLNNLGTIGMLGNMGYL